MLADELKVLKWVSKMTNDIIKWGVSEMAL